MSLCVPNLRWRLWSHWQFIGEGNECSSKQLLSRPVERHSHRANEVSGFRRLDPVAAIVRSARRITSKCPFSKSRTAGGIKDLQTGFGIERTFVEAER